MYAILRIILLVGWCNTQIIVNIWELVKKISHKKMHVINR